MNPITFEQLVAIISFCGVVVAMISSLIGVRRDSKRETTSQAEARIRTETKLDTIADQIGQQHDTLQRIDQKLDDHGQRIDKLEAKVEHLSTETYHRLERVEGRLDHMGKDQGVGGTD